MGRAAKTFRQWEARRCADATAAAPMALCGGASRRGRVDGRRGGREARAEVEQGAESAKLVSLTWSSTLLGGVRLNASKLASPERWCGRSGG